MFQNLVQNYTLIDASVEISVILLGTFALGMLLGWLIKPTQSAAELSGAIVTPIVTKNDDLQLIEGIGPAIEKLLHKHQIYRFQDIVLTDVLGLEEILEKGGSRFKKHIPTTWPDQARLASEGKWTELEEYQEILNKKK